jgi:hypothetical protein
MQRRRHSAFRGERGCKNPLLLSSKANGEGMGERHVAELGGEECQQEASTTEERTLISLARLFGLCATTTKLSPMVTMEDNRL